MEKKKRRKEIDGAVLTVGNVKVRLPYSGWRRGRIIHEKRTHQMASTAATIASAPFPLYFVGGISRFIRKDQWASWLGMAATAAIIHHLFWPGKSAGVKWYSVLADCSARARVCFLHVCRIYSFS